VPSAAAVDLGVLGPTYRIVERDMLDAIEQRIRSLSGSGELDGLMQGYRRRAKAFASRPPGVSLPRADEHSLVPIDTTFVLGHDIEDGEGNVLFPAGTTIRPLEHQPLTRVLCFIDGDDRQQVEWLRSACPDALRYKRILVSGDATEVQEQLSGRIYFDQRGYLGSVLSITAVPTVVRQIGDSLYAEQIPIR
jgi:conjugal transfer pilus assembly protein TraW